MGVDISKLIESRHIEQKDIANRKIAVDALNTIYQFVSIIRDRFTGEPLKDSKGQVTSHLSGLFYRNFNLLRAGILPIYVFDGEPPDFKKETSETRRAVREEAERKWKEAVKRGEIEKVKLYAQGASRVTDEMLVDSKKLLKAMGIPCIQAPSEGEAQCAYFCKKGDAYATASQDYDSLIFGSPRLIKNLNITGRRKVPRKEKYILIKPELIELKSALKQLGINQEQLIILGILIGTDYNPGGVKGIGPKNALKLVKEYKTLEDVLKQVDWTFRVKAEEIFNFIKNPPVEKISIPEEKMQPEKIIEILVEEHDFSKERVEKTINAYLEESKRRKQTGLGSFLR